MQLLCNIFYTDAELASVLGTNMSKIFLFVFLFVLEPQQTSLKGKCEWRLWLQRVFCSSGSQTENNYK